MSTPVDEAIEAWQAADSHFVAVSNEASRLAAAATEQRRLADHAHNDAIKARDAMLAAIAVAGCPKHEPIYNALTDSSRCAQCGY